MEDFFHRLLGRAFRSRKTFIMAVLKVVFCLGLCLLAAARVSPCLALQTGPPTLENLLNPTANDLDGAASTPFDEPQRKSGTTSSRVQPGVAPFAPPAKRLAVPDQSAVDEALELIHQAYEETIKAAAANPESTVRSFRDTADKTNDPARKFALLTLAERLALEARATSAALDALARRAALFDIDALASRHALLAKMARAEDIRPDALLFEHVVETARQAVAADRYDLADAAADLAETLARAIEKEEKVRAAESRRKREPPPKAVAVALLADATNLRREVRERRRQAFDYTTARDKLAAFPDDADAAETVGRYLCFVKRDWPAGLPLLARGRNEGLRNLATREIALSKEPKVVVTSRFKLANEWWKLAEAGDTLTPEQAEAIKSHASGMYRDIAGLLTDPIDAALARKRAKSGGMEPPPAATATAVPEKPAMPTLDSLLQGDGR
jgi:hypothetical protein